MNSDSDPPPPPDTWTVLWKLLGKLLEHFTKATDLLAPGLPVLEELRARLKSDLAARPQDAPDAGLACLLTKLDGIIEAWERAAGKLARANRIAKRAHKKAEACKPPPPPPPDDEEPPPAPTIRRLKLCGSIKGPHGRICWYLFEIDGQAIRLPRATGVMLIALANPEGEETDHLVPFKTRARLAAIMQLHEPDRNITPRIVSSRQCQFKVYLEEGLGAPEGLIESCNGHGSRLRLEWPPPEDDDKPPNDARDPDADDDLSAPHPES